MSSMEWLLAEMSHWTLPLPWPTCVCCQCCCVIVGPLVKGGFYTWFGCSMFLPLSGRRYLKRGTDCGGTGPMVTATFGLLRDTPKVGGALDSGWDGGKVKRSKQD